MKIKSNLQLKVENLISAINDLMMFFLEELIERIESLCEKPKVKSFLGTALVAALVVGFIGIAWMIAYGFFALFGKAGLVGWLEIFASNHPFLAIIWLIDSIFTAWFIATLMKDHEPKA